eukprot:GEMP01007916.1.p1 GENE.GEMP01007916.1~~GEMP01007916.1.p1  ORF type:complete len:878 (+),score=108.53 GEMP01007916.1:76-2709(+)
MVPLIIALLSVFAQDSCKTVGGEDCIFPFSWNGLELTSCTYFNSVGRAYTSEEGAWCPTSVNDKNEYVGGSKKWDYCSRDCAVEETHLHWGETPDACITTDLLQCVSECVESSDALKYPWCYTSSDQNSSWGRCNMQTCTLRHLKLNEPCGGKEDKCLLPLTCNGSKKCATDKVWGKTWEYVSISFAAAASIYMNEGNMVKNNKIIRNKSSTSWCPQRSIVDNEFDETNHRTILEGEGIAPAFLCYQPCYSASSWSHGAYRTPGICWGCPKGYGYSHASLCYVNGRHQEAALAVTASAGVVLRSYITGSKPFTLFGHYDAYFDDLACGPSEGKDDWTYDHWSSTDDGVVMGRYYSPSRKLIVISFRGTDEIGDFTTYNFDFSEAFNWYDVVVNTAIVKSIAGTHTKSPKECAGDTACSGVFVPINEYWFGFANYFLQVKDKFAKWLEEAKQTGSDIVLTGHSLGGAAAYFAAYYATKKGIKPKAVITWASPGIAMSNWITRYEENVGCDRTISFANDYDPIAKIPGVIYDIPCASHKIKLPAQNQGFREKGPLARHDLFTGYHLGLQAFFQTEGKDIRMDTSCPYLSVPKHCRDDFECEDATKTCQFGRCVSLRSGDYCHGKYQSRCGLNLECISVDGNTLCNLQNDKKGTCVCKSTDFVCFGYWKPGEIVVTTFPEKVVTDEEACVALCRSTGSCNLVTYDTSVKKCYRKTVYGDNQATRNDCDESKDGRTYLIDRFSPRLPLLCNGYPIYSKNPTGELNGRILWDQRSCADLCLNTPECNIATYDTHDKHCYLSASPTTNLKCDENKNGWTYINDAPGGQARSADAPEGESELPMVAGIACLVVFVVIGVAGVAYWKKGKGGSGQGENRPRTPQE